MFKFENYCSVELLSSTTEPLLTTNPNKIGFSVSSQGIKELEPEPIGFD